MAKPRLGLVYLGKVDLANAYMQLWVRLEDTLSVELLIPRKKPAYEQLVGFQLYLPMGYMDITPYLCMSTETIVDILNDSMDGRHMAPPHPLEGLADASALSERETKQDGNKQWSWTPPPPQTAGAPLGPGRHLHGRFYLDLQRRPQGKDTDYPPPF